MIWKRIRHRAVRRPSISFVRGKFTHKGFAVGFPSGFEEYNSVERMREFRNSYPLCGNRPALQIYELVLCPCVLGIFLIDFFNSEVKIHKQRQCCGLLAVFLLQIHTISLQKTSAANPLHVNLPLRRRVDPRMRSFLGNIR